MGELGKETIDKTRDDVRLRQGKGKKAVGLLVCSEGTQISEWHRAKCQNEVDLIILQKGHVDMSVVRNVTHGNKAFESSTVCLDYFTRPNLFKLQAKIAELVARTRSEEENPNDKSMIIRPRHRQAKQRVKRSRSFVDMFQKKCKIAEDLDV